MRAVAYGGVTSNGGELVIEMRMVPWRTLITMARENARCFEQARAHEDEHAEEVCVRAYAAILAELARRKRLGTEDDEAGQA